MTVPSGRPGDGSFWLRAGWGGGGKVGQGGARGGEVLGNRGNGWEGRKRWAARNSMRQFPGLAVTAEKELIMFKKR